MQANNHGAADIDRNESHEVGGLDDVYPERLDLLAQKTPERHASGQPGYVADFPSADHLDLYSAVAVRLGLVPDAEYKDLVTGAIESMGEVMDKGPDPAMGMGRIFVADQSYLHVSRSVSDIRNSQSDVGRFGPGRGRAR